MRATTKPITTDAGQFCYFIDAACLVPGYGYRPKIVYELLGGYYEHGTWPFKGKPGQTLPYFWGKIEEGGQVRYDLAEARRMCARANRQLGVTQKRAAEIVAQSMRLQMLDERKARSARRKAG